VQKERVDDFHHDGVKANMPRVIELFIFALIIYFAYRRIAAPFRRGFNERERERQSEGRAFKGWRAPKHEKIDRSNAKDAEFKDLK
jgi:hypothetical protein